MRNGTTRREIMLATANGPLPCCSLFSRTLRAALSLRTLARRLISEACVPSFAFGLHVWVPAPLADSELFLQALVADLYWRCGLDACSFVLSEQ